MRRGQPQEREAAHCRRPLGQDARRSWRGGFGCFPKKVYHTPRLFLAHLLLIPRSTRRAPVLSAIPRAWKIFTINPYPKNTKGGRHKKLNFSAPIKLSFDIMLTPAVEGLRHPFALLTLPQRGFSYRK